VRVEEVGYQLQFSKQELRKVIKEYSGREVCLGCVPENCRLYEDGLVVIQATARGQIGGRGSHRISDLAPIV